MSMRELSAAGRRLCLVFPRGRLRTGLLRFAIAGTLAAFGACSHQQEQRDLNKIDTSHLGTVVLSVSHDLVDATETNAFFFLDERTLGPRGLLATPPRSSPGDFKSRRGQVIVLSLAPGRHSIDRWQLETTINVRRPKDLPAPLVFEVMEGEVTYIGNLHLQFRAEPGFLGAVAIRAVRPVVVDRSEEDMQVAEDRMPHLHGKIRARLLPLGPWLAKTAQSEAEAATTADPRPDAVSYAARLAAAIRPNINFSETALNDPALQENPIAEVEVRVAPGGQILGRRLLRSSGVRAWDEAVLKAIDLTRSLPLDQDGRVPSVLQISFRPR